MDAGGGSDHAHGPGRQLHRRRPAGRAGSQDDQTRLTRDGDAAILRGVVGGRRRRQVSLRGVTKVRMPAIACLVMFAVLTVAACGGSTPAASTAGAATPQPSSSLSGTEPPVSAKPGKPVVTVD